MIVIDRIEGTVAILEIEGSAVEISVGLLPEGTQEGSVLSFVLSDNQATELQRDNEERLKRLRAQDPGDMEIDI